MAGKIKDIKGKRFGRLIAIKFCFVKNETARWLFRCDCGIEKIMSKRAMSCGCIQKEKIKNLFTTHGMTQTRFYNVWKGIQQRCNNPKHINYKHYGGRGIKCEWKSFEEFRDDIYKSYLEHVQKYGENNTTIDRINNDGNYSKENCRWATRKEQSNNTRTIPVYTFDGKTLFSNEWENKTKISKKIIYERLHRGWSIKEALSIVPKVGNNQCLRK